jgi:hypothetical protein
LIFLITLFVWCHTVLLCNQHTLCLR